MLRALIRSLTATVHMISGWPMAILTSNLVQTVGVFALVQWAGLYALTPATASAAGRQARGSLFAVTRLCSDLQCARFRVLLGVRVTPAPVGDVAAGWRQVWYHLVVALLIELFGGALLLAMWAGAVMLPELPVLTPPGSPGFRGLWSPLMWTVLSLGSAVLVATALVLAPLLARLDVHVARSMMQSSRAEELALRVRQLSHSRAEVVDAADAERRRIERDLHDGAQQRLVSLAVNLGLARANLSDADPEARRVIEHAHDEAKQALAELRELVRGLHPAVLNDRGLDAALSGIAARSPVPARLTVDLRTRPSPTVEAVAYFVVSEALSNVAKHSRATSVEISVRGSEALLHIEVRDDGVGGANPSGGTGLRGLAQRVSSVDGSLAVSSPAGGPTVITVELPCES